MDHFWKQLASRRELMIFILLLALGAGARLYELGSVPGGLNQDEASMGYDAFSLLHYGIDRNGSHNPVQMIAWGSGQNALEAYMTIPFIAAFDLSVTTIRLVPALFGICSLILFYFLARRLAGSTYAAIAMFLLAISPWHLILSRWALESNMLPGVILIAMLLLVKAQEQGKMLYLSFAFFALSLYAYSTAYVFVPVFLGLYALYAFYYRIFSVKEWLVARILFALIATPIGIYVLVNMLKLETITTSLMTMPRMPGEARYTHMTSFFSQDFWTAILANFHRVVEIIFIKWSDGETQSSAQGVGTLYVLSLPFFAVGLLLFIRDSWRAPGPSSKLPILLWLLVAFLVAILSSPAVHRMNLIWLPILLLSAYGLLALWRKWKILGALTLLAYMGLFIRFEKIYYTDYANEVGDFFFESYTDAVSFAYQHAEPTETLYLSDYLNQPYIHVLFITQYDTRDYINTANIPYRASPFQTVKSFGRFIFGLDGLDTSKANVVVARPQELSNFRSEDFIAKPFKNFTVLFRRSMYAINDEGIPVAQHRTMTTSDANRMLTERDTVTFTLPENLASVQITSQRFYAAEDRKNIAYKISGNQLKIAAGDLFPGLNEVIITSKTDKFPDEFVTRVVLFRSSPDNVLLELDKLQGSQSFGALEKNRAYEGSRLNAGPLEMPWGFGTHANSRYRYSLQPGFDQLQISYGLSIFSGDCGDGAIFEILGDGQSLVEDDVPRGQMHRITLSIKGMQSLEFRTSTKESSSCDHTNWMGAVLVATANEAENSSETRTTIEAETTIEADKHSEAQKKMGQDPSKQ